MIRKRYENSQVFKSLRQFFDWTSWNVWKTDTIGEKRRISHETMGIGLVAISGQVWHQMLKGQRKKRKVWPSVKQMQEILRQHPRLHEFKNTLRQICIVVCCHSWKILGQRKAWAKNKFLIPIWYKHKNGNYWLKSSYRGRTRCSSLCRKRQSEGKNIRFRS